MQFFRNVGHAIVVTGSFLWRSVVYIVMGSIFMAMLLAGATAVHVAVYSKEDNRPESDTILVLGAAQYDGRPSNWLAARLDHAADLYESGVAPTIVTVGGSKPGDRFTEAEAGKNYLINEHGVPEGDIISIGEGVDTLTSAEAFDRMSETYGWGSTVVVTDPAHSLRATQMVRDQGFDAAGSPTRTGPSSDWNRYAHETGGLIYYEGVESERDNFRGFIRRVI